MVKINWILGWRILIERDACVYVQNKNTNLMRQLDIFQWQVFDTILTLTPHFIPDINASVNLKVYALKCGSNLSLT